MLNEIIREFSDKVLKELFPNINESNWTYQEQWRKHFAFGYKIDVNYLADSCKEYDVLFFITIKSAQIIDCYTRTRSDLSIVHYEKILEAFVVFLEKKNFNGYISAIGHRTFVPTDNINEYFIPVGKRARKVQELAKIIPNYFDVVYGGNFFRPKYKGYLPVLSMDPYLQDDRIGLKAHIKGDEFIFLENENDIKKLADHYNLEIDKMKKIEYEIASLVKSYDSHSYHKSHTQKIFAYNKLIPLHVEKLSDDFYRIRVFYKTIKGSDLEDLLKQSKIITTDYLKKNRIKRIIEGNIFTPKDQFYYKVFGSHTKNVDKMLLQKTTTTIHKSKFLSIVEKSASCEKILLEGEDMKQFKETFRPRGKMKEFFKIGELSIYLTGSKAYIEKSLNYNKIP